MRMRNHVVVVNLVNLHHLFISELAVKYKSQNRKAFVNVTVLRRFFPPVLC